MDLHIPTVFWAGLNLIILLAILLGSGYLIFYIIAKVKAIDKRVDNIEREISDKKKC